MPLYRNTPPEQREKYVERLSVCRQVFGLGWLARYCQDIIDAHAAPDGEFLRHIRDDSDVVDF